MNQKQFRKYLDRDDGCVHCGATEAVSPHHRLNRGMGGSKVRDVPSNIITVCSWLNSAMESDSTIAERARKMGWKLRAGDHPALEPVYHYSMQWRMLDDHFGFHHDLNENSRVIRQLRLTGL
jgi:hypothetical protein